ANKPSPIDPGKNVKRRAAVERGNTIQLPVAKNCASKRAQILERRQRVNYVENQRMPSIEISISFVQVVVENVGGCAYVGLSWDVTDRPRQSVSNLESQSPR